MVGRGLTVPAFPSVAAPRRQESRCPTIEAAGRGIADEPTATGVPGGRGVFADYCDGRRAYGSPVLLAIRNRREMRLP